MTIAVGDVAPLFELPVHAGEAPLRLEDYRGYRKVVLLFFPLAFSGVCTEEMCAAAEEYSSWTDLDAEILGISVDSPYVNRRFAAACGVTFPMLSDFNKEVIESYGVMRDHLHGLRGVAERAAFVVDREGRVAYAWISEHPGQMPDFDAIREAVRSAA